LCEKDKDACAKKTKEAKVCVINCMACENYPAKSAASTIILGAAAVATAMLLI
jgi:hypothetical protein